MSGADSSRKEFSKQLCKMLIVTDIPLCKINNPIFKSFFNTYTKLHAAQALMSALQKNYESTSTNTPLPPQPILTRWGTWLEACSYMAKYLPAVESVVRQFDPNDAGSIADVQAIFETEKDDLKRDLAYIEANFSCISGTITLLENRSTKAVEAWSLLSNICDVVQVDVQMKAKLDSILKRNVGLTKISSILSVISLNVPRIPAIANDSSPVEILNPSQIVSFRHAPLTSVDVERVFSRYKCSS